jgi:Fe-S-cluster containining protein
MSFICRQCRKCCRELMLRDRGILRGLTLLPEEIKHFPEEQIKPYLGAGKRPYDPKFEILAYQLTAEVCPHLEDDKCTIYLGRPVTCRQFPFSLDPDPEEEMLLGVDMNCSAAVELVNTSGGLIEFPDRDSAMGLYALKKLAVENPRRTWLYDLDKEKWVRYDKLG